MKRAMPFIAFSAAIAILVGISIVSIVSVRAFAERAQWVEHTQNVLRETEAVLADLNGMESSDRGYVISGNETYLTTYSSALERIPKRLERLRALTADNSTQQEKLRTLEKLVDRRTRLAERFVESARSDHLVISPTVKAQIAAGKSAMDEVQAVIGDLRAREEELLARRARESARLSVLAITVILTGTAASISMLIVTFVLLRREIGSRARAEQAAHAAAVETENLYNQAPCGYHSVDKEGFFIRINDTELEWLGYTRDEVIGKKRFVDIVAPECVQTVRENFPNLVAGKGTINLEYTLVRKDGGTIAVTVNALPVLDANGEFLMSRTTMFDISALQEARHKLEHANVFLDAVVENIPSMLFVKHADTLRFARINRAEERLLGMRREDIIGKSDHDLFPKPQADFFVSKDHEVLEKNNVVEIDEEALTTPDGTLFLRTRKIGLRDSAGRPQYLLGISEDITKQKHAEEAIRALNSRLEIRATQLEAANKELESFTYSVSHDLRAPLRAIDGFSKIFEEDYGGRIDDEGRRLLRVIRENSQRMGMLIDDLLAYSRLGRQPIATQQVDMRALAHTALEEARAAGSGTGAEATVTIGDLPPASADPALLRQVWVNLLSNALKYSAKKDHPTVEAGFIPPAKPGQPVTYFVRDNGVGFDMRYYDKLFGVFQRLHRADEFTGTGVGLAIVHRLLTRQGGKVWADAALDQGATFYFALPAGEHHDGI